MREIETDYLVVGAGATGMSFVDSLIASSDADAVLVDRRHRPGGHWLDAYPFVRLHQSSANYGVNSRVLGYDRIDESGPNAGFYERATAPEITSYFNRVLEEDLLPSGRVRFLGMCDYRGSGPDGHHVVSRLSGEEVILKVRRRFVDATYVESSIPSTHVPSFEVDPDVRLIPPNDLVDMAGPAAGYTVIGAGKTAMDTCNWLLDVGVAPDEIRWIKPRDGWYFDRAFMQPLDLVGAYMQLQACWVEAAAEAGGGADLARRLEEHGIFVRLDPEVAPDVFRGATISKAELESLRQIDNVIRQGKVLRIGTERVVLEHGSIASEGHVFVDCTAAGVRPTVLRPVFEPGRITMQYVTIGIAPWSAAIIAVVEASRDNDAERNRLCPPVVFTGETSGLPRAAYAGMSGLTARALEPDLAAWDEACRLNPSRGAANHTDDPRVPAAFAAIGANFGPAMSNLERLVAAEHA
jgi:hypothetical protein